MSLELTTWIMNTQKLPHLYHKGLIPGPYESEEAFLLRCEELNSSSSLSLSIENPFNIFPDWIPLNYSNKGLLPWHGGCSWISNDSLQTTIQLRKSFEKNKSLFGIYSRNEILAHEWVHAARMTFDEPKFEEVIAFRTSKNRFRRYFGPLVNSYAEGVFFAIALVLYFVSLFFFSSLLPIAALVGVMVFGIARLIWRQSTYRKCLRNLSKLLGCPKKAEAMTICLTDREIQSFSKQPFLQREELNDASFRWKQIRQVYFS